MLTVGARVDLHHARTSGLVTRLLGEGAQGRVFVVTVELDDGPRDYALKWFRDGFDTAGQRATIDRLVAGGAPSRRFLWPIDVAHADGESSFGYLMMVRPPSFAAISDLLNGRLDVPIATLATVGFELADSFLVLHAAGLCYRDINLGNVFFDPADGAVLICDVDNVGIDGLSVAEIAGSPFFSAPEIVRGEALPSIATDRFSLAVLLFLLMFLHHPLEGALVLDYDVFDEAAEADLFGREPCFIYDPYDPSNRPVPGLHDNAIQFWPRFPHFLRELFVVAFTDGLHRPNARVPEGMWRRAMSRLRDAVLTCQACGVDVLADDDADAPLICWQCGHPLALPPRLVFGPGESVFLMRGRVIAGPLAERLADPTPLADVTSHPDDATLLGLRNLTSATWRVWAADAPATTLEPGRSVAIVDRLTIEFGSGQRAHVETSADPAA